MSIIHFIIVVVATFGAPANSATVDDAWSSLKARGGCSIEQARYVDSGEHGTTQEGEISVWSVTDENLFHHFTCN